MSPDMRKVMSLANHRSLIFRQNSESSVLLHSFRHFPYNENPTRTSNTTSLKCCLRSTDAIYRGKNSRMCMEVHRRLMKACFIEIHNVFAKRKVRYIFNRVAFVY